MIARDAQANIIAPPPAPSNLQRWNAASANGDLVRDLMMFVGRANNWFDIYKALEISIEVFGNERDLVAFVKKNGGPDLKKLKRTANHYRHATKRNPLPQTPPNLVQGREQLRNVAMLVLANNLPKT